MDIATLLHTLTLSGLTLRVGSADALEVVGEIQKLSLQQQQALREHKQTLLSLLTTTCYLPSFSGADEREAIQFADTPEAIVPLAEAIEFFERLADDMRWHNPDALAQVVQVNEPWPTPCKRCLSQQTYLAIIHAGESLRRDCSNCGRFIEFPSWHNRKQVGEILAHAIEQNKYNETSCKSDINALASSNA